MGRHTRVCGRSWMTATHKYMRYDVAQVQSSSVATKRKLCGGDDADDSVNLSERLVDEALRGGTLHQLIIHSKSAL